MYMYTCIPGGIFVKVFLVNIQTLNNIDFRVSVEEGGAQVVLNCGTGLHNG